MRVKLNSSKLLVSCGIPEKHALSLQGVNAHPTGYRVRDLIECEFTYGAVFGMCYQPFNAFAYLIPVQALEGE
jgi:hypothetical protein